MRHSLEQGIMLATISEKTAKTSPQNIPKLASDNPNTPTTAL
jgi:hypothetical protein